MVGELPAIEGALPESVRSLIEKKIGDLSEIDRTLMSAAAVQGQEFDAAVVASVLGMDLSRGGGTTRVARSHARIRAPCRTVGRFPTIRLRCATRSFTCCIRMRCMRRSGRREGRLERGRGPGVASILRRAVRRDRFRAGDAVRGGERLRAGRGILSRWRRSRQRPIPPTPRRSCSPRRGIAAVELLPEAPERAQRELRLQTTLGPALMSTVGYGAPEVEAAYIRARDLCPQVGEVPQLFHGDLWPVSGPGWRGRTIERAGSWQSSC